MPFYSAGDGDLKTAFVSDAWLIDQFVGNTLYDWGYSLYGNLGDNTTASHKSNPVQTIAQGNNWKQISVGTYVTSAIKNDATLWTWGRNSYGQLGDNTLTNKSSPVQTVSFGTNWKQVSSGAGYVAAIKTDGTLWTWGNNTYGQLGDNTTTKRSSPVQTIAFGVNWKQVACNGVYELDTYTAAIKTDGTLWTWGGNTSGQLGDNTLVKKSSPVQTVAFGTNWKQVSAGKLHTAAIKTDGTLWAWGSNDAGQLGDNTLTNRSSPVQTVSFGTNWKQVSCGYGFTAAIKTDGTLWCWGANGGQLGDNTTTPRSSPVQTVSFGTNWKQVSCGFITAAIKTDSTLWTWGSGLFGGLGDNTTTDKSSPVQTSAFGNNWKQCSSGFYTTGAVTNGDL